MKKPDYIVMGIDPGTLVMGYALIAVHSNKAQVLVMDVLKLSAHKDVYLRLEKIHTKVAELIAIHKPDHFAIEAPFFGKNVQSMLKLGRAQGVAIAAAMQGSIPVTEYSPKKVKQSITGNGSADKEQVWKMLQQIMQLDEKPAFFDATDALAVAMCHHYQLGSPLAKATKGLKGWEDFIAKNPGRITINKR